MLTRAFTVLGLSVAGTLVGAVPALAGDGWGYTDCEQYPFAGCELGAGKGGRPGGPTGDVEARVPWRGTGETGPAVPQQAPGDRIIGGDSNLANCSYERSSFQAPPPGALQPASYRPTDRGGVSVQPVALRVQAQPQDDSGAWYVYRCSGPGVRDALYRPPVWIPDGEPDAAAVVSPAQLAQQARNQLRLPSPVIRTSPAGDQLVHLPTWLWLDRSSWGDVSASASVPGVSVTAVARPTSVTWSMGDGGSVTCTGPGSPFPAGGDPKSASPDCGYTYRTSSVGQRGEAFPVSATVNWTVTWSGAGQGGTFPNMTTTGSAAFRVAESQGIATG